MRILTLARACIVVALQLLRRFFRDDRKETEPPCALDSNNGKSALPSSTPSPLHGEDNPGPPLNNEQHPENDDTSGESEPAEKSEENSSPRKPRNIGSRRGATRAPQGVTPAPRRPSVSRPELVCRENPSSRSWEVFLSADEECLLEAVCFRGKDQKLDITNSFKECHIRSLYGCLSITYGDGQDLDIPLFKDEPLIFKLRKNWKGVGRRVSRITKGYFILIAPNTQKWERIGHPPIAAGDCIDPNFQAHYLDTITPSEDPDGLGRWKFSSTSVIELIGQSVFDDSEEGILFVGDVPTLKEMSEIIWARVGREETGGCGGDNFKPHEKTLLEILGNREGRFFLRVYNKGGNLIDSVSFRYLRNLKQIRINGKGYTQDMMITPTPSGYLPMEIGFVGTDDTMLSPQLPKKFIGRVTPSNLLEIPPSQKADSIICVLKSSGGSVNITLNLPRIWWRIKSDYADFDQWRATFFSMQRQKFSQLAKANAKICLSLQKFQPFRAGFDDDLDQKYHQPEIPLNDFAEYIQITDKLEGDAYLNIMWGKEIVSIIRICADPVPKSVISPQKEDAPPILARVRNSRRAQCKWRNGKGFSLCEIQDAGLTVEKAKSRFIPFDSRRRSSHAHNVKEIRRMLNEC